MAVTLNPRAERLLARLPRVTVYSALELFMLVLIAVQCARLFWSVLTPLGPVGDWKSLELIQPVAATPTLGGFDPFFRNAGQAPGPATVTALDVRLYGVMGNQATGGGSAIIGLTNGPQRSFAVGEEIVPGVTLTGIAFDHVTISRGGTIEELYLDQTPASGAGAAPTGQPYVPPASYSPPAYTPPTSQTLPVPTVAAPPPAAAPTNQAQSPRR
jgi:general secretion pathway protein C